MSAPPPVRAIRAAGGVVWRRGGASGIEVVLVGRPAEGLWALPKGKPERGETPEQTALREVSEETGLRVAIDGDAPIGSIRYSYRLPGEGQDGGEAVVDKIVDHYLMRPRGGDPAGHDGEYDLVRWFDAHEACRRLTFPNERAIVERAIAALCGAEAPP